jgi:hypothetical protein
MWLTSVLGKEPFVAVLGERGEMGLEHRIRCGGIATSRTRRPTWGADNGHRLVMVVLDPGDRAPNMEETFDGVGVRGRAGEDDVVAPQFGELSEAERAPGLEVDHEPVPRGHGVRDGLQLGQCGGADRAGLRAPGTADVERVVGEELVVGSRGSA